MNITNLTSKPLIGQRVIYRNSIVTVIDKPGHFDDTRVYIRHTPEFSSTRGQEHWVDLQNLKPLPGGQL